MRSIDDTVKAKHQQNIQTKANNNNPSMEIMAVRPRTAIYNQRFWQESTVAEGVTAVCTSVAIKRTGRWGETAYVAYVDSTGLLTVKSAPIRWPIRSMVWTTVTTIAGCAACALEFDGSFVRVGRKIEFRTDATPWLLYTTTGGQLMAGILGGTYESLVGANVTAFDAVRGVASLYEDEDQGLMAFFIQAGSVYHRDFIAGIWEDQAVVSLAPANAVKIKAERVFDWRIVLQITDSSGSLYEVFSKMQASGWNSHELIELIRAEASGASYPITYLNVKSAEEYITLAVGEALCIRYANYSPTIYSAENIATTIEDPENPGQYIDDYGYRIIFEFDQWIPNAAEYPELFKIEGANGAVWYGQSAAVSGRFITVSFNDFNGAGDNPTVRVLSGGLTNGLVAVTESSKVFAAVNLVPPSAPAPVVTGIENIDATTIIITFDLDIEDIASQSGFDVIGYEPLCSPGGELVETEYVVESIDHDEGSSAGANIDLSSGDFDGLEV